MQYSTVDVVCHCGGGAVTSVCVCVSLQGLEDENMKSAAIDIFSYIVEFSPSMVREYLLNEAQKQDDVSLRFHLPSCAWLSAENA